MHLGLYLLSYERHRNSNFWFKTNGSSFNIEHMEDQSNMVGGGGGERGLKFRRRALCGASLYGWTTVVTTVANVLVNHCRWLIHKISSINNTSPEGRTCSGQFIHQSFIYLPTCIFISAVYAIIDGVTLRNRRTSPIFTPHRGSFRTEANETQTDPNNKTVRTSTVLICGIGFRSNRALRIHLRLFSNRLNDGAWRYTPPNSVSRVGSFFS